LEKRKSNDHCRWYDLVFRNHSKPHKNTINDDSEVSGYKSQHTKISSASSNPTTAKKKSSVLLYVNCELSEIDFKTWVSFTITTKMLRIKFI
jgi:hypothetical protein